MLIGGQDRGQQRFGLMQAERAAAEAAATHAAAIAQAVAEAETAAPEPAALPASVVTFAPEKPLMAAPSVIAETPAPADPAPEGRVFYIAADGVNVREGPGKNHAVIDRLPRGEAVLVLDAGEGPNGWSRIRIEGDGIEGYVASRLLSE